MKHDTVARQWRIIVRERGWGDGEMATPRISTLRPYGTDGLLTDDAIRRLVRRAWWGDGEPVQTRDGWTVKWIPLELWWRAEKWPEKWRSQPVPHYRRGRVAFDGWHDVGDRLQAQLGSGCLLVRRRVGGESGQAARVARGGAEVWVGAQ